MMERTKLMSDAHPNILLLQRLDPANMAGATDLFAPDVVFHYYNPNLPELQGDHVGLEGIGAFFAAVGRLSKGTFKVEPVSAIPVGDELVVVHSRNRLTLEGREVSLDVVVVWRFADGRIVEVWDIVPTGKNTA